MEKTAEVALLLADDKEKHGGQGWNRTSDTGIFSPKNCSTVQLNQYVTHAAPA